MSAPQFAINHTKPDTGEIVFVGRRSLAHRIYWVKGLRAAYLFPTTGEAKASGFYLAGLLDTEVLEVSNFL